MHEISLVQGLLKQLRNLAKENRCRRITRITMEIGALSGVVIDSFRFGFEALSADDDLVRDAQLVVEVQPVTFSCTQCGHEETAAGHRPGKCLKCGELFLIYEGGDDLILRQVEME